MRHYVERFAAVLTVQVASAYLGFHDSRVTIVAVQRIAHKRG